MTLHPDIENNYSPLTLLLTQLYLFVSDDLLGVQYDNQISLVSNTDFSLRKCIRILGGLKKDEEEKQDQELQWWKNQKQEQEGDKKL